MPKRYAARYCSECGIVLPSTSRAYAELDGGWAVEHGSGGAHNVRHPLFTGRVLCAVCFDAQRPPKSRAILYSVCLDCETEPVRFRQIRHAWTQLPATKSVHDATYGNLTLCADCWAKRMEGVQLGLFDA
jgi:hypothetical protein